MRREASTVDASRWLDKQVRRRRWLLAAATATAILSLAYMFWWGPVVRHVSMWVIPGDVWSTFRAAHWVGWGRLGGIYGGDNQLVTFPGIAVLLAPVAMLSNALGLSESIAPILLAHPTSWYLLGPATVLLGCSPLFAVDALAEELGVQPAKRAVLCWAEATVIFQVVALWGHPEDMVALAAAVYALLAMFRRNWALSGWLWGAAIVVQPLALLMFPLAFVWMPRAQRARLCVYASIPTVVLVGVPLLTAWGSTSRVLFKQANSLRLDHATPWVAFSPHLGHENVGAGPGRVIAILAAIGIGAIAARRRPSPEGILWMCALALSLRCVFEAVMDPFYLGPPLATILLAASLRNGWAKLSGVSVIAVVATVVSFHQLSEWVYWTPMALSLAVCLALAWPGSAALGTARPGAPTSTGSKASLLRAVRRCASAPAVSHGSSRAS